MTPKIFLIKLCLITILVMTGCTKGGQINTPTKAATSILPGGPTYIPSLTSTTYTQQETPILMSTQVPAQMITQIPTTTSFPTPSDSQLGRLFRSLQDDTCRLPCYLGIIPGQTTSDEASYILESMGATNHLDNTYVSQDNVLHTYSSSLSTDHFSQRIRLYVSNGVVIRMEVDLFSPLDKIFYEHWSEYSIISLFRQFGVPDSVYVGEKREDGNEGWVLYHHPGIFMGISGITREDDLVCPEFRDGITTRVFMLLFDSNYPEALSAFSQFDEIYTYNFQDGELELASWVTSTIETVLGIGPDQFYEQLMAVPETCFERARVDS